LEIGKRKEAVIEGGVKRLVTRRLTSSSNPYKSIDPLTYL